MNAFIASGSTARDYLNSPVEALVDVLLGRRQGGGPGLNNDVADATAQVEVAVADVLQAACQVRPDRDWGSLIDLLSAEVVMLLIRRYIFHGHSPSERADETDSITAAIINGGLEKAKVHYRVRWDEKSGLVIMNISTEQ